MARRGLTCFQVLELLSALSSDDSGNKEYILAADKLLDSSLSTSLEEDVDYNDDSTDNFRKNNYIKNQN